MRRKTFDEAAAALLKERKYQTQVHGPIELHAHSEIEWIAIMRRKLNQAEDAWMKGDGLKAKRRIVQATATGCACIENCGDGSSGGADNPRSVALSDLEKALHGLRTTSASEHDWERTVGAIELLIKKQSKVY